MATPIRTPENLGGNTCLFVVPLKLGQGGLPKAVVVSHSSLYGFDDTRAKDARMRDRSIAEPPQLIWASFHAASSTRVIKASVSGLNRSLCGN